MIQSKTVDQQEPWFRNPWVWLVIAIPGCTVLGCLLTIYLAVTNPHQLIADLGADSVEQAESVIAD